MIWYILGTWFFFPTLKNKYTFKYPIQGKQSEDLNFQRLYLLYNCSDRIKVLGVKPRKLKLNLKKLICFKNTM